MATHEEAAFGACRSIIRSAVLLRKELHKVFSAAGLSGPQFGILNELDKHGRMPLSELGKRLWVSCGDVTGLVDKLVAAGHVRRIRLRKDRRVILADLTDQGRDLIGKLRPVHYQCLLRLTAQFQEPELRELTLLLEKLHQPIEEDPGCPTLSGGE